MPHLPRPARSHAVAVHRVVRRAATASLPEVQTRDMKAAVRDVTLSTEVEMMASSSSEN